MTIALRTLSVGLVATVEIAGSAASSPKLRVLPPSDPVESAAFVADYPVGKWVYGAPLRGLNIHECDEQVCIAALNARPYLIMVRTISAKHHPQLTIVVQNCVINSTSYDNLPADAHEFKDVLSSILARTVSSVAKTCKGARTEVPQLDTGPLVRAAQ